LAHGLTHASDFDENRKYCAEPVEKARGNSFFYLAQTRGEDRHKLNCKVSHALAQQALIFLR
jgi:hypothetical protein